MKAIALTIYVTITNRVEEIRNLDRERGLTTTEIAVLTFVLVAIAVAIGALLYNYAEGRVEALPEDTTPSGIPDGSN